jgi:hypothetical protein
MCHGNTSIYLQVHMALKLRGLTMTFKAFRLIICMDFRLLLNTLVAEPKGSTIQ